MGTPPPLHIFIPLDNHSNHHHTIIGLSSFSMRSGVIISSDGIPGAMTTTMGNNYKKVKSTTRIFCAGMIRTAVLVVLMLTYYQEQSHCCAFTTFRASTIITTNKNRRTNTPVRLLGTVHSRSLWHERGVVVPPTKMAMDGTSPFEVRNTFQLFSAPFTKRFQQQQQQQKIRRRLSTRQQQGNALFQQPSSLTLFGKSLARGTKQMHWKKIITSLLLSCVWVCFSTNVMVASAASSPSVAVEVVHNEGTMKSLVTMVRRWFTTRWSLRKLATSALAVTSVVGLVDMTRTRRRQAVDATSEWGRYADYPSARGRALATLLIQLLPSMARAKFAGLTSSSPTETTHKKDARPYMARAGNMFAEGLLRLGPLYIKMGQILSCRENVLPPEWITSLERLQDRVPARSGQDALDLAYEAFSGGSKEKFDAVFWDFDDVPLAAASLGQVHKARLRGDQYKNATVAIKLQRPRLRDIYDKDLILMSKIAAMVDKVGGAAGNVGGVEQSWTQIFSDAETILYREIDYRDEADNAIRFCNDFGLGIGGKPVKSNGTDGMGQSLPSAATWLRSPYVYDELTSEKVLVMEFVPSIKINNQEKLDQANVTVEGREFLAECLARAYLRQFCCNQFFSTDPHPGNLGVEVQNKGKPPRLVFYDFGQACGLSPDQAGGILDVIEGTIDMDAPNCVTAFSRMGVLKEGADLNKVEAKVRDNFETGRITLKRTKMKKRGYVFKEKSPPRNVTSSSVSNNNNNATEAGKDSEVMKFFTLPAEYAFVARAISQMDGVGKGLDPDFDFISACAPYLVEVKGVNKYLKEEATKVLLGYEKRIMDWEKNLFKRFGFDPSRYADTKKNKPTIENSTTGDHSDM
uniref:ABC1 atypical kinase-like domain-containing protein n=1 Tax=Attheya septentrionalis TaxID=420275 RepID=A0A7S2XNR5_9STRA|mmetsp:Transcript_16659/g.30299  ORF Transcript_16659/g.30299 Transcript_16659/m.30299 type:complete len:860 (+) Transcript_16659:32-2611(+)